MWPICLLLGLERIWQCPHIICGYKAKDGFSLCWSSGTCCWKINQVEINWLKLYYIAILAIIDNCDCEFEKISQKNKDCLSWLKRKFVNMNKMWSNVIIKKVDEQRSNKDVSQVQPAPVSSSQWDIFCLQSSSVVVSQSTLRLAFKGHLPTTIWCLASLSWPLIGGNNWDFTGRIKT